MTITSSVAHRIFLQAVFIAMLPIASAVAWQATPPVKSHPAAPVLVRPATPRAQFRQSVQQHAAQDQLRQNQLEQQLHQGVADSNQRSSDNVQQRAQQDLQDRQRRAAELPRVLPQQAPAPAHSGG